MKEVGRPEGLKTRLERKGVMGFSGSRFSTRAKARGFPRSEDWEA
jgi:hypothetical protein